MTLAEHERRLDSAFGQAERYRELAELERRRGDGLAVERELARAQGQLVLELARQLTERIEALADRLAASQALEPESTPPGTGTGPPGAGLTHRSAGCPRV